MDNHLDDLAEIYGELSQYIDKYYLLKAEYVKSLVESRSILKAIKHMIEIEDSTEEIIDAIDDGIDYFKDTIEKEK